MKLAILRAHHARERRVPIVPEAVKRLRAKDVGFVVEPGAGEGALFEDAEYEREGASITSREEALASSDGVLMLRPPTANEVAELREGTTLIAPIRAFENLDVVRALCRRGITTYALDAIPRTTAAQMMDVLSSQASCVGYHAVVAAAGLLPRFFPMLITAAGTIAPATLLVLGAGVAGLSAIGAGRRLGARVEAFDVRRTVKEQVESLGAKFVDVPQEEDAQTAGGYAREASDAERSRQKEVIAKHVAKADVVICTALVPGKRAPILVTEEMVASMRKGSVVVDLAVEQGGNCAGTELGTVVKHGVTIVGDADMASKVAVHASQMWSRNMEKLLVHITEGGRFAERDDEIVRGSRITHRGAVMVPALKEKVDAHE